MPGHGLGGRRLRKAGLEMLLPQLRIRPSAERHRRLRAGVAQARRAAGEGGGGHARRRRQIHRQGGAATTRLMPAPAAAPTRILRLYNVAREEANADETMALERLGLGGRPAAGDGVGRRDQELQPRRPTAAHQSRAGQLDALSPPIVNNGVMFIATPQAQVIALDAKTGEEIWRYKRQLPEDLFQLHPTSRGVGLWQDKLYLATTDDHLVALDAKTGKVAWDQKVQDYR